MNYLKDRKTDAPADAMPSTSARSPLELHPVQSHTSSELPDSLSTTAQDVIKQHSETATNGMTGSKQPAVDLTKQQQTAILDKKVDGSMDLSSAKPSAGNRGVLRDCQSQIEDYGIADALACTLP